MRRAWLLLLPIALAACPGHATRPPAPPPAEDPLTTSIRAAIEPLYEREVLHGGMVVAAIEPGKDPRFVGFGRTSPADGAAPDADAIFEIGSISKVLTGLLLSDAVARGEVSLDTPVAQLVPFGVRFPDADGVRPTLGDLVSHRSGLPTLPDNLAPADVEDPYAGYGEAQLYDYLEHAQLQTTPGTTYAYSNLGAGILGHVLARKLGVPYAQAVAARVLGPLGLTHTWTVVPEAFAARLVPGTTPGGEPTKPWTFDVLAGAGAWRSTARDLAALVEAAIHAAAGQDVPLGDVLRASLQPLGDAGPDMQIATAWHITAAGIVWHNGMTGGYASFIGFDPATQRGVVVLASTASPLVTKVGMKLFDLLAGKPFDLGLDLVDVPTKDLDLLAGPYRLGDGSEITVVRTGDALYVTMGPDKVRLYPRSATEFLVLELESTVEFVVDGDVVRGFTLHLPQGDVDAVREEDPE